MGCCVLPLLLVGFVGCYFAWFGFLWLIAIVWFCGLIWLLIWLDLLWFEPRVVLVWFGCLSFCVIWLVV